MKCLLVILDGLGDRGEKTPLSEARTPTLDRLAKEGDTGQFNSVGKGIKAGSDTAHLAIFGYDPYKEYNGRGPLEAAGSGLTLEKGDVALRGNFATLKGGKIIDRRAGREETGLDVIAKDIDGKVRLSHRFKFVKIIGHRCVLVLRNVGGYNVNDSDPHVTGKPMQKIMARDSSSVTTADEVREFSELAKKIMKKHPANEKRKIPANCVIFRGCGGPYIIPNFKKKWNMSAACCAKGNLYRGVASVAGFEKVTDDESKIPALLKKYDLVFWHMKDPDLFGHDGDFDGKKKAIEKCDKKLGGMLKKIKEDLLVVVTGDHSTPVSLKDHSGDPVPILFWGKDVRPDKVKKFSEEAVMEGGLDWLIGKDLMPMVADLLGKDAKFGE